LRPELLPPLLPGRAPKGEVKESPRKEFLYWNDDGELVALRISKAGYLGLACHRRLAEF
jgi:hypothetical protein